MKTQLVKLFGHPTNAEDTLRPKYRSLEIALLQPCLILGFMLSDGFCSPPLLTTSFIDAAPPVAGTQYKVANDSSCAFKFIVYYQTSCANSSNSGNSGLIVAGVHELTTYTTPSGTDVVKVEIYNPAGSTLLSTWLCTTNSYSPDPVSGACPCCNTSGLPCNNNGATFQGDGHGSNKIDCAP